MLNRKLLEVLSRLDSTELKKLRLLLLSPYINPGYQDVVLIELYDYIISYQSDEEHPMLDKAVVFARFFPGKPYRENEKNALDGLMSKLVNLVRTFLMHEKLRRDAYETEYQETLASLQFYRRHGLEERFWQTVKAASKRQEEWPYKDARHYQRQFSLAEEIAAFKTIMNTFQDDANIETTSYYLDTYYSIVHLEIECALMYQQQLTGQPYDDEQISQLLSIAHWGEGEQVALIRLYKLIIHLLKDPYSDEQYNSFETLLDQSASEIPAETYSNLKAFQRYFWSRRYIKSGEAFYRQKLFDLYKDHFEKGYFYVDGSITLTSLRVLIIFALKLGHFDWVKKVLDDHPPSRICGTRYPAEAHNLNLAEYHFSKKEYPEAVEKLQYRLFENPNFSLFVDVLLIKIYFETEDELLESRMKALEQKVRRVKISPDARNRYTNFLKKLDKINRHIWQKESSRYEKMTQEIKTTPQILEREWLLEILERRAR